MSPGSCWPRAASIFRRRVPGRCGFPARATPELPAAELPAPIATAAPSPRLSHPLRSDDQSALHSRADCLVGNRGSWPTGRTCPVTGFSFGRNMHHAARDNRLVIGQPVPLFVVIGGAPADRISRHARLTRCHVCVHRRNTPLARGPAKSHVPPACPLRPIPRLHVDFRDHSRNGGRDGVFL